MSKFLRKVIKVFFKDFWFWGLWGDDIVYFFVVENFIVIWFGKRKLCLIFLIFRSYTVLLRFRIEDKVGVLCLELEVELII